MKVATSEAIVEKGLIKLSEAVCLHERAMVYVVVTGIEEVTTFHLRSPRLGRPECAADFAKEVVEEPQDAGLR